MHGEPGQDADVFEIGLALEPQESEGLINTVTVLSSLGGRVGEVCVETTTQVGIGDVCGAYVEIPLNKLGISLWLSFRT